MEKKNLIELLNEIFFPLGFKRKGNNWVSNGKELSKIINLQKSNYSNSFYINYGYNINSIELTTTLHIYNRFASTDKEEQKAITNLLDLDYALPQDQRLMELKKLIIGIIISKMKMVNSEEDILQCLIKRSQLNDIPLIIKKHFQLE